MNDIFRFPVPHGFLKLQRRGARIFMQTDSSDEALAHLNTIYDTLGLIIRRETHVLKLVEKCLNKRCPTVSILIEIF